MYARVIKTNDGKYDTYYFPAYKFGYKEGNKPESPSPTSIPSNSVNLLSNFLLISLLLLLIL